MAVIVRRSPTQKDFYGLRDPRYVKGYPTRPRQMIRRKKRHGRKLEYLRQPRPRRHARQALLLRTKLSTALGLEERAQAGLHGSLEERIVFKAFVDHDLIPGVDFDFQSSQLGGRGFLGGLVADFIFEYSKVVVQVQSYWHTITSEHHQRDTDQSLILQSMGYTVLEIWPNTIHSQVLLDQWITNNLQTLNGIGTRPLGVYKKSREEALMAGQGSYLPKITKYLNRLKEMF